MLNKRQTQAWFGLFGNLSSLPFCAFRKMKITADFSPLPVNSLQNRNGILLSRLLTVSDEKSLISFSPEEADYAATGVLTR